MEKLMNYKRVWAMPNKNTFEIKPIYEFISIHEYEVCHELIDSGFQGQMQTVDPFCGESKILTTMKNDIRISGIDSAIWLLTIPDNFADIVLFDPPYTPRQKKECYDDIGVHLSDTRSSYWSTLRDQIKRITKPRGRVISFGYSSVGIGKERGFEWIDGLLVCHGGQHNDTIVTVERKL